MAANPIPNSELNITTEANEKSAHVFCSGRITSSTTDQLTDTVRPLLAGRESVILDLTNVQYMDSSGLGALVRLYVSARREHCQIRVVNLNKRLKEIFSLTRLGEILCEGRDPEYPVLP